MPIQNPLDIWPALMKNGLKHVYRVALEAILRDPGVDGAICIAIAPDLTDGAYLDATSVIEETAGAFPDKPVAAWLYGPNQARIMEKVDRGGKVVCFPTPPRAARAMAVLHQRHRFLAREASTPPSFPENTEAVALAAKWAREGRKKVEGEDAGGLLRHYGIPVARTRFCLDLEEILGAADAIGYPVALKVSSPRITHKTDAGGLRLGLNGPGELEAAHGSIAETIERRGLSDGRAGFLVQEMVQGGLEVILGAKRDPQFGPTLVFGRGGIHTEVWRDIAYGIAPLSEELAWDMINQTRVSTILGGVRGEAGFDMALLRGCLLGLSRLMMDLGAVREIDINPFKAFREGGKAVDVRIILETEKRWLSA
jgi:acetyltransferase